jgi:hypothetical protein
MRTHSALAINLAWGSGIGWRPSSYSARILVGMLARAANCPIVNPFFSLMLRSIFIDVYSCRIEAFVVAIIVYT